MTCSGCGSNRVVDISAKSKDLNVVTANWLEIDGYLPNIENIGSGDYVEIAICLECGQCQGTWPASEQGIIDANNGE